ncbi:hypothetical protein MICA_1166 [Micavibrio aeruginosavorus ARL-13]|uniref:Uncharacterized protein n=1 Tax=Micavibrio aeruginosavorus (strain ARL-13) TaxID=856793 RepID=G2KPI9_MICAA|nr:hypothetical protein MICA_1166 [Micavibrio aeruginosavorus ARL-13]
MNIITSVSRHPGNAIGVIRDCGRDGWACDSGAITAEIPDNPCQDFRDDERGKALRAKGCHPLAR